MRFLWNGEDPFEGLDLGGQRGAVFARTAAAVRRRWPAARSDVIVFGPIGPHLRPIDATGPEPTALSLPDEPALQQAVRSETPAVTTLPDGGQALLLPVHAPGRVAAVLRVTRPSPWSPADQEEAIRLAVALSDRIAARRYAIRARLAAALATLNGETEGTRAVAEAGLAKLVPAAGAVSGAVLSDHAGRLHILADVGEGSERRKELVKDGIPFGQGLAWSVFATGEPRFEPRYHAADTALDGLPVAPTVYMLPLGDSVTPRWVLSLAFDDHDPPTDDALDCVHTVLPTFRTALDLAATRELEDRLTELTEELPDRSEAELAAAVARIFVDGVPGADAGALLVHDHGHYLPTSLLGDAAEWWRTLRPGEAELLAWYVPEGQGWGDGAARVRNAAADGALHAAMRQLAGAAAPDAPEILADLTVPILVDGRPIAVASLHALTRASAFDATSLRAARQIAVAAAAAWRIVRQRDRIQRDAVTDALTGVANRRGGEVELARALARAERTHGHASLVLLDLGSFKQVNDTYGHDAGDRALQAAAAALSATVRGGDVVVRWGGDEFLVILPQDDAPAAHAIAERLIAAIREVREGTLALAAHAGVATYPADAKDADELVRIADARMYDRKRTVRSD